MGANSEISWTDNTFSPWWGCQKVSEGCKNCYAETLDNRYNNTDPHWGPNSPRKPISENYWKQPLKWNSIAEKAGIKTKVFCASMADVFEDNASTVIIEGRMRLFDLIEETPNLIWQLLTKRPEKIMVFVPEHWRNGFPDNVWMGTSVENQNTADVRIPHLLKVPANVRFLSCEPLLGEVDLTSDEIIRRILLYKPCFANSKGIDWVIAGGESGHHARPVHPDWIRSLRDQCKEAGVAFFFKQWGEYKPYQTQPFGEGIPLNVFGKPTKIYRDNYFIDLPGNMPAIEALKNFVSFKVGKKAAGSLLDGAEYKAFPI